MVKRFHGSRRFIFTGSSSATHVLLSSVFFLRKTGNSPQYIAMFSCVVRIGSLAVGCPEVWARMYGFFTSTVIYAVQLSPDHHWNPANQSQNQNASPKLKHDTTVTTATFVTCAANLARPVSRVGWGKEPH